MTQKLGLFAGNSSAVNQVAKGIKNIKIKDPVNRSSVSLTLNERLTAEPRQTNQDPCELRYFKYEMKPI